MADRPLAALRPFVGTWAMETTTGPVGRTVWEWMPGEQFLIQRWQVDGEGPPDGLAIIGLSPGEPGYIQHYFDSRGMVRLYSMRFDLGMWTLTRTRPDFSPLHFSQRYAGSFSSDGDTIEGRWQTSDDGQSWRLDFTLTYRRSG
jgi:hypothetical protein